jgi:hypothetical protein
MRPPLLAVDDCDEALRDLMPLVEQLTNADLAFGEGLGDLGEKFLHEALKALRRVPPNSSAIKAYLCWLEQNQRMRADVGELRRQVLGEEED